jgi:hypothetical protein
MSGTYSDSAAFVARIDALEAELKELRLEEELNCALINKQGDILRGVANALHGAPLVDGWWSHHDLAEIAAQMRAALYEIGMNRSDTCPDYVKIALAVLCTTDAGES